MELVIHPVSLQLTHPFTISRGTRTRQEAMLVELQADGISGWGEVTQSSYYQHSTESLTQSLNLARQLVSQYESRSPEEVWPEAMRLLNNSFAVSGLDVAAHDWHARKVGLPLWQLWKLEPHSLPSSSYTIAIDSMDKMLAKLSERPDWPVYKIKLGTDRDIEIVRNIRQATKARLRVDANCAWTVEQTIDFSGGMAELGVEFIEQPLPANACFDEHLTVYQNSRLPIIADESCQVEEDVDKCYRIFHGVNVKLSKCGGLTPARRMLIRARQLGMRTMVGCMIESSIGISAAAQLLPLLDFADLDGAALLENDPATGIEIGPRGIQLNQQAGHGAYLRGGESRSRD